eukprot:scaffold28302_cov59-Phaeocystis_antarctica.AAC.3
MAARASHLSSGEGVAPAERRGVGVDGVGGQCEAYQHRLLRHTDLVRVGVGVGVGVRAGVRVRVRVRVGARVRVRVRVRAPRRPRGRRRAASYAACPLPSVTAAKGLGVGCLLVGCLLVPCTLCVRVSARWHLSVPPVLTLAKLPVLPAEVIVRKPQRPDPHQGKRERRSRLVEASVGMQLVQVA